MKRLALLIICLASETLLAKDKFDPKDYNWYPIAPEGRPRDTGEFYKGLIKSNASHSKLIH